MANKKYLITGGSGFIGTNLVELLAKTNDIEVLNIDLVAPKIKTQNFFWKQIDIRDYNNLYSEIEAFQPDVIIHLAARTDLRGISLEDYSSNTLGTEKTLDVLERLDFNGVAIFASSMYVCIPGYKPKSITDYSPHTIYGESKVEMEKIIRSKNPRYKWTIVRPTSIWGPWFGEPYFDFFKIVDSGRYFHISGSNTRKTYGYVTNTIYQLLALAKFLSISNDDKKSDILNGVVYLGDDPAYTISEWANEIAHIRGKKIPTLPKFIFEILGIIGDTLIKLGIKFPMTSFRLKNMSTDNVHDLSKIISILPKSPVDRLQGTIETLAWIDAQRSIK